MYVTDLAIFHDRGWVVIRYMVVTPVPISSEYDVINGIIFLLIDMAAQSLVAKRSLA